MHYNLPALVQRVRQYTDVHVDTIILKNMTNYRRAVTNLRFGGWEHAFKLLMIWNTLITKFLDVLNTSYGCLDRYNGSVVTAPSLRCIKLPKGVGLNFRARLFKTNDVVS